MKNGETAIRARQRSMRAAARRPTDPKGGLPNSVHEALATDVAKRAIQPPGRLLQVCGEVADLDDLNFISAVLVDTLESPTSISVEASEQRMHLAAEASVLQSAFDASETIQARNSLEKMLAHQMAASHRAAMRMVSRVGMDQMPTVEMARLSNASARMMQVFHEGLMTLQKLRNGGKQTVLVQHVQVSGGQAVIAQGTGGGDQ